MITLAYLENKDYIKPRICFEDIILLRWVKTVMFLQEGYQVASHLIISVLCD